jgi:flagellar hook-associated protein 3 FlgL
MRVTSNTFPDSLASQLNSLALRQYRLQTQASSGLRIQNPDDDPAAMGRVLDLQAESRAVEQQQQNIAQLKEQCTAAGDILDGLKKISDRAGELATLADGTKSPEELRNYGAEVTQLLKQAVQLVNGQFQGHYLLGGTLTDQPPFVAAYDADGQATSVAYQGNTSVSEAEIATGATIAIQTLGANDTGAGPRGLVTDARVGADFFNHLISLQNHLEAGDTDAIAATDRPNLGKDEENLLYHVATNGAVQSRLDSTASLAQKRLAALGRLVSGESDADLAETLVRLNQTQTAYQAALQSGAKILNTSLLDYLQ